jgi:hypothetical protein
VPTPPPLEDNRHAAVVPLTRQRPAADAAIEVVREPPGRDALLFIIVPTFREPELVRSVCEQLIAQTHSHFVALIVNCDPGDATTAYLSSRPDPRLRELQGDHSWFWGRAVRAGQEYASLHGGADDCVVTLNADVEFPPSMLADLLAAHCGAGGALVASTCQVGARFVDSGTLWRCKPLAMTRAVHRKSAASATQACVDVDLLTGRATLYSLRLLRAIGPVDAVRFPHYGCDMEFSARAKQRGWRCIVVHPPVARTGVRGNPKEPPARFGLRDLWSPRSPLDLRMRTRFIIRVLPRWAVPTALAMTWGRCIACAVLRLVKTSA